MLSVAQLCSLCDMTVPELNAGQLIIIHILTEVTEMVT